MIASLARFTHLGQDPAVGRIERRRAVTTARRSAAADWLYRWHL
jgi:hypothetical protein